MLPAGTGELSLVSSARIVFDVNAFEDVVNFYSFFLRLSIYLCLT